MSIELGILLVLAALAVGIMAGRSMRYPRGKYHSWLFVDPSIWKIDDIPKDSNVTVIRKQQNAWGREVTGFHEVTIEEE